MEAVTVNLRQRANKVSCRLFFGFFLAICTVGFLLFCSVQQSWPITHTHTHIRDISIAACSRGISCLCVSPHLHLHLQFNICLWFFMKFRLPINCHWLSTWAAVAAACAGQAAQAASSRLVSMNLALRRGRCNRISEDRLSWLRKVLHRLPYLLQLQPETRPGLWVCVPRSGPNGRQTLSLSGRASASESEKGRQK